MVLVLMAVMTSVQSAWAQCVVVLHGLARSETSLLVMETALVARACRVINDGYPSTDATIEILAQGVGERVAQCGAVRESFGSDTALSC